MSDFLKTLINEYSPIGVATDKPEDVDMDSARQYFQSLKGEEPNPEALKKLEKMDPGAIASDFPIDPLTAYGALKGSKLAAKGLEHLANSEALKNQAGYITLKGAKNINKLTDYGIKEGDKLVTAANRIVGNDDISTMGHLMSEASGQSPEKVLKGILKSGHNEGMFSYANPEDVIKSIKTEMKLNKFKNKDIEANLDMFNKQKIFDPNVNHGVFIPGTNKAGEKLFSPHVYIAKELDPLAKAHVAAHEIGKGNLPGHFQDFLKGEHNSQPIFVDMAKKMYGTKNPSLQQLQKAREVFQDSIENPNMMDIDKFKQIERATTGHHSGMKNFEQTSVLSNIIDSNGFDINKASIDDLKVLAENPILRKKLIEDYNVDPEKLLETRLFGVFKKKHKL